MTEINTSGQHLTTEFDAYPLIPEEVANEILTGVTEASAALSMFSRLPNMSSRSYRMPILDALGDANFLGTVVDDDLTVLGGGADVEGAEHTPENDVPPLKGTHQMKWDNVYITAAPIAIILPVPDDVLDDSDYDLWAAMQPRIVEAFHQKIDNAIIWGQGRPEYWPSGIVPTTIARGFYVVEGTGDDIVEDISNFMGALEVQGYDPSGFMASPSIKAVLRNLRSVDGVPLFTPGFGAAADQVYGQQISYVKNASFQPSIAQLIAGKMDEAKYAIRSDLSFKLFTEGVITDDAGNIVLNLMQQDAKAMRVVMRLGWAVPNPIHALRSVRAESYPFATLLEQV